MENKSKQYERLAEAVLGTFPVLANLFTSRAKLYNIDRGDKNNRKDTFNSCLFCGIPFSSSNSSVRLIPKPALNSKIKRLLGRHSTHPSSLGNFQSKLVKDYIHGKNVLAVTCHVCKKTTKLAGQNRQEKHKQKLYQERQATFKEESEGGVKVSTRKERKKERRKLQRKRKAGENEDINAGLTLAEAAGSVSNTAVNDERTGEDIRQPVGVDQVSRKTETSTKQGEYVSERMSIDTSHRNTQSVIKIQEKETNTHSIGRTYSTGLQKATNKKNKSKKMSQKLSNMLKQEQTKQTEGTLEDFLSSL